jgi:hypothetical protein
MKKQIIFMLLSSFSIMGCVAQGSVKDIAWLEGSWKGMYNNAPFYEAWRKVTDSMMVNLTIEIKGTDTIVKENGALRLMKKNRCFVGKDASWEIESLSADKIVLKNDTLKYANRIIWSHSLNDHWQTEIHNPKAIIKYDLERMAWLDDFVNRFIRKARSK